MSLLDNIFGLRCRMCGRHGVSPVGPVTPTQAGNFQSKDFTLQHCRKCDVVYLDPLPTESDLKLLYEESVQFTDAHYTAPEQVEKILESYTTSLRSLKLLPPAGSKVLEIGAGLAWVSRACTQLDASLVTVAQDVSAECVEACPWVNQYFVGPLDALPERGPYQLISLTHVLEHLADPATMLQSIAKLLCPGGNAFITAPYRPSGWKPGDGISAWCEYSYLHVPAHISYFSKRWFQGHASGLKIAHWDNSDEGGQAFAVVLHKG